MKKEDLASHIYSHLRELPENYFAKFLSACFRALYEKLLRASGFFQNEIGGLASFLSKSDKGSFFSIINSFFMRVKKIINIILLAALSAFCLAAFGQIISLITLKSVAFMAAAATALYTVNFLFNLAYTLYYPVANDIVGLHLRILGYLAGHESLALRRKECLEQLLGAIDKQGLSISILEKIISSMKDFDESIFLKNFPLSQKHKITFSPQIQKYLDFRHKIWDESVSRIKNELFHKIDSILFNPDHNWSLERHEFLKSGEHFVSVQKKLKEFFNIDIDFKEALLYQMKTHQVCVPKLIPYRGGFHGMGIDYDIKNGPTVERVLGFIGANGDDELYRRLVLQISQILTRHHIEYIDNDYVTPDFCNQMSTIICSQTGAPNISLNKDFIHQHQDDIEEALLKINQFKKGI